MRIVYQTVSGFSGLKKDEYDLGIDLQSAHDVELEPGEVKVVGTGTHIEFPILSRFRRWLSGVILGFEITGIGGIIKPRSRYDFDVLAGVVDVGYRGEIKVKVYNSTGKRLRIALGERIAQIVLIPTYNAKFLQVYSVKQNTKRGTSGGINVR